MMGVGLIIRAFLKLPMKNFGVDQKKSLKTKGNAKMISNQCWLLGVLLWLTIERKPYPSRFFFKCDHKTS